MTKPGGGSSRGSNRRPANKRAQASPASRTSRRPPPVTASGRAPVVGKRPSNPAFLLAVSVMWLACALGAAIGLHAGWKVFVVVVFAGMGLFYLRAAAGAYARREAPPDTPGKPRP